MRRERAHSVSKVFKYKHEDAMSSITIDLTSPVKDDGKGPSLAEQGQRKSKVPASGGRGSSSSSSSFFANKENPAKKSKGKTGFIRKTEGILGKRVVGGASALQEEDDDFMSPERIGSTNETKKKKHVVAPNSSTSSSPPSSSMMASLSYDPYKVLNNQTELIKKSIGTRNLSNIPDPRARLEFLMDCLSKISESQSMISVVEQKIRTEMKKASKLTLAQNAKGPVNLVTEREVIDEKLVDSLFPKLSESELASAKDWWNKTNLQGEIEHSSNSVVLSVQRGYNPDGTALPEDLKVTDTAAPLKVKTQTVDRATNTSPIVMSLVDSSQSQSQSEPPKVACGEHPSPKEESAPIDLVGSSEETETDTEPALAGSPTGDDVLSMLAKNSPAEAKTKVDVALETESERDDDEEKEEDKEREEDKDEVGDEMGLTQPDNQMEAIVTLLSTEYPIVYQKMLLFHPVPLDELHACLKGRVRIGREALKKLMAEQCIFISQHSSNSSSTKSHKTLNGAKYRQWSQQSSLKD